MLARLSRRFLALRFHLFSLGSVLYLVMFAGLAAGQLRAVPVVSPSQRSTHPADEVITTNLSLNLCVEGSAAYPCPNPILSDDQYLPAISLTYGQVLDGVVLYSPASLTFGTILIYKDAGAGPDPICVLAIGSDKSCPPDATVFDVGDYTLTATLTFFGSSGYAPSSSLPVVVSVQKDTSEIALGSSQNPAGLGSPVTITATATGGYGAVPTGQVIFTVDGIALDPVDLDASGKASFITSSLALGTHNITASYPGATNFYPAADTPVFRQQIVPPATATTLTSSLNPSAVGDKVSFTASLGTALGFTGTPSGSVTFRDGNVLFATSQVMVKGSQYLAQAAISTLAFGSHSITAAYSGDGSTSPSLSPVLIQQVDYPLTEAPPGYKITVSPSPIVLGVGQTADLTVTVTPVSGFFQPVTLSCTSLPDEAACTFQDITIPAGGGQTKLALSTMAPHDCGSDIPYFTGQASLHRAASPKLRHTAPLLAGLVLLLLPRRRRSRWLRSLLTLAFACSLISISGCGGNCTDFGTPPGSYTFKVNGTTSTAPGTGSATTSDLPAVNVNTSVALSMKL